MSEFESIFTGGDEMEEIRRKLADLEAQVASSNPRNIAGIREKELRALTRQNFFGDGSDGDVSFDGTNDYTDFASKSGSTYTLTRDVFAQNLTVKSTCVVKTNGYRIFVTADLSNKGTIHSNGNAGGDGTVATRLCSGAGGGSGSPGGIVVIFANRILNDGTISVNGGNGGNGSIGVCSGVGVDSVGGTGGAAAQSAGTLPATLAGAAGGKGGGLTPGEAGTAGTATTSSIGVSGVAGGNGGAADDPGYVGGAAGTATATKWLPKTISSAYALYDFSSAVQETGSASSGGGGGGDALGSPAKAAGGGGGAGGSGGALVLVYGTKSGSGSELVAGGTGGSGASGCGTLVTDGTDGTDGLDGVLYEIVLG